MSGTIDGYEPRRHQDEHFEPIVCPGHVIDKYNTHGEATDDENGCSDWKAKVEEFDSVGGPTEEGKKVTPTYCVHFKDGETLSINESIYNQMITSAGYNGLLVMRYRHSVESKLKQLSINTILTVKQPTMKTAVVIGKQK